jgi:hypothetical protein
VPGKGIPAPCLVVPVVRDLRGEKDLQTGQKGFGVPPTVRLNNSHHDVSAALSSWWSSVNSAQVVPAPGAKPE